MTDKESLEPSWFNFTLRFIDTGTDPDTVNCLLQSMRDWVVQLETSAWVRDVMVKDFETYISPSEQGITVVNTDENGDPYGDPYFVSYDVIKSIGIY